MGGMGGGGGMGTLQALLAEMSGLKKPRGFFNRHLRRVLGMRPKPPPKYRILHIFATNMPQSLDEAMLRPGRIDRIYKVGYPSKEGRKATYDYYLAKVKHELTADDIDKLATMTPYATGANIQDIVNEALVIAIRDGREVINVGGRHRAPSSSRSMASPTTSSTSNASATRSPSTRRVTRWPRTGLRQHIADRRRDDRTPGRRRRVRLVDPAGGPVHPVADRVRRRHHGEPGVAGRRTDVLRRRQLQRGGRRPAERDGRGDPDGRRTASMGDTVPRTACRSSAIVGGQRGDGRGRDRP